MLLLFGHFQSEPRNEQTRESGLGLDSGVKSTFAGLGLGFGLEQK